MTESGNDHTPSSPQNASPQRKPRRHGMLIVLLLVVATGGLFGARYMQQARTRIGTDDAYLTADITQIAPQVSGTVLHVYVQDDQVVQEGQLLAELDPETYQANVEQAEANLETTVAQARGAGISVSLTDETGSAQIAQALGGVAQADSGIAGAHADVQRAQAGIEKAKASEKALNTGIGTTEAAVDAALANKKRAQAAVETALAQVNTARAGVKVAEAAVAAAQATADKTARDTERYAALLEKGAVSRAMADQAAAAARVAQAQLDSARQQVAMAQEVVTAREADVVAAREQVQAADAAVSQARAALAAAHDTAGAASADVRQAQAQRQLALRGVDQAEAKRRQALGQLQQAQTRPKQVDLSASGREQAQARVSQAQAALRAAQLQLAHTKIYAPVAGMVSKRSVQVGALVQPGTPLMALTQTGKLWVVANYKETQLSRIVAGQRTEVSVDALGGRRFTGHVASISAGTGSTFALLPPDNASGNFTKVVQRVPVRIDLDPNQPEMDRLRAGLSVEAVVLTR